MTMITPSYLGETIEYSSLHACRSTLEDPTKQPVKYRCLAVSSEAYSSRAKMQHFLFKKFANCVKSRRNFRIPMRVSQVVTLGNGEFSLILLNFALNR